MRADTASQPTRRTSISSIQALRRRSATRRSSRISTKSTRAPVTYMTEPNVSNIVANGTASDPSSVLIEKRHHTRSHRGGRTDANQRKRRCNSDRGQSGGPTTESTGVLLEAQGAALIDVQAGATVVDSTAEIANGGTIQFETAFSGPVTFSARGTRWFYRSPATSRSDLRFRRHRYDKPRQLRIS